MEARAKSRPPKASAEAVEIRKARVVNVDVVKVAKARVVPGEEWFAPA
jgi:hypothetical protein